MSREADQARLERIVVYIKDVDDIVRRHGGVSPTLDDVEGQYAILLCLTQIGELLGKITDPAYQEDLPIRLAVGLRNIIVHDYEGVDMRVIEYTITKQLPALKVSIDRLLAPDL